jgi:hypothetical protein
VKWGQMVLAMTIEREGLQFPPGHTQPFTEEEAEGEMG